MINKKIKKLNQIQYLIVVLIIVFIGIFCWILSRSSIKVNAEPTNAIITIDNKPMLLNRKGYGKMIVKSGNHTVKVEADGYVSQSERVFVKKARTLSLQYVLDRQPKPGAISSSGNFLVKGKNKNEILFLNEQDKTIYNSSLEIGSDNIVNSSTQAITSPKINGVQEIAWSPNKDLALFKKSDGVYLFDFQKYDFVNQTETLWGKDIGDIAWAPDNSKIAYFYHPASGEKSLIFANITNTENERVINLANLQIDDPILKWSPDSEWLIIIPRNKDYSTDKIYLFDSYSRTLKQVTDTGNQTDAFFSPDSSKILYTTYSKDSTSPVPYIVSVMNLDGTNQRSLGIRTTLNKICWPENSASIIILSQIDPTTNQETISTFNIDTKATEGVSIVLKANEVIQSIIQGEINDKKAIAYQTKDGIYAIPFKSK